MSVETTEPEPAPAPEMSVKAMVLLGGAMTLGVALVLGLTLLLADGDRAHRNAVTGAAGAVPVVTGQTSNRATSVLAARRLAVGAVIQVPSSLPAGQVVRTAPAAGAPVPAGTAVTLYLSAGSGGSARTARITVPYLVGIDAAQARAVAAQLGLRTDTSGPGRVTAQKPAAGTDVPRGTAVHLELG